MTVPSLNQQAPCSGDIQETVRRPRTRLLCVCVSPKPRCPPCSLQAVTVPDLRTPTPGLCSLFPVGRRVCVLRGAGIDVGL